jgi:hypothetical protein
MIEKTEEYYYDKHYERINTIRLGKALKSPPNILSADAQRAWQTDVKHYLNGALKSSLAFNPPEIDGPYNVVLDYVIDDKTPYLLLTLTSEVDEGEFEYRVNIKPLKPITRNDRELASSMAQVFKSTANPDISAIQALDKLKNMQHARAASVLMDAMKNSGLSCRYLDFCKSFFSLLRVIVPTGHETEKHLKVLYEPRL